MSEEPAGRSGHVPDPTHRPSAPAEAGRGPVPRSRSGAIGRRWARTGTEPATAQSALRLRVVLSGAALPLFAAGAVLIGLWAANSQPGPGQSPSRGVLVALAVVCGAVALVAALDLWALNRRLRRERGSRA